MQLRPQRQPLRDCSFTTLASTLAFQDHKMNDLVLECQIQILSP